MPVLDSGRHVDLERGDHAGRVLVVIVSVSSRLPGRPPTVAAAGVVASPTASRCSLPSSSASRWHRACCSSAIAISTRSGTLRQAGFFLAPIIYPLGILPERFHFYLYLWPPTPVIEFSRRRARERHGTLRDGAPFPAHRRRGDPGSRNPGVPAPEPACGGILVGP